MEWYEWIGKNIFVKLQDGSVYNGKIINCFNSSDKKEFLEIIDKFGEKVCFPINEIRKIKEESDERTRFG